MQFLLFIQWNLDNTNLKEVINVCVIEEFVKMGFALSKLRHQKFCYQGPLLHYIHKYFESNFSNMNCFRYNSLISTVLTHYGMVSKKKYVQK